MELESPQQLWVIHKYAIREIVFLFAKRWYILLFI